MSGVQRYEVIEPSSLERKPFETAKPSYRSAGVPETHTMRREEVIDAGCWWGDCGHDEECPTREAQICDECTTVALDSDGEGAAVVPWPCPESGDSR